MRTIAHGHLDLGHLKQLLVDSLPDCGLVILDVDGKILTWNAGAEAMHGHPGSEMIGQDFSCLYIQADIDADGPMALLADALADGRHEETRQRLHKDGTSFEVQDVLIPLYDPQKKLVGFGNLTRKTGRSTSVVPVTASSPIAVAGSKLRIVPAEPRRKVLLVDDDEAVRGAARDLLTGLGYEVMVASSGPEALELLARVADIHVLFTDVVMPGGIDGGELAKEATALRPAIKVLFTSGYFEGALVRQGSIAANTHFLVKPYRKRDLAKMMDEVLGLKVSAA